MQKNPFFKLKSFLFLYRALLPETLFIDFKIVVAPEGKNSADEKVVLLLLYLLINLV